MRRPLDEQRLRDFLRELGQQADADLHIYLTGGATAVLCGWRKSTVAVDLKWCRTATRSCGRSLD
jgi:hypothetical protein